MVVAEVAQAPYVGQQLLPCILLVLLWLAQTLSEADNDVLQEILPLPQHSSTTLSRMHIKLGNENTSTGAVIRVFISCWKAS